MDNNRNSLPSGTKPVINVNRVKIIKTNMNQELKMKGRKLNLRFKDFAKKNPRKIQARKCKQSESEGNVHKS